MSDIVINSENFKRFSKRLQKTLKENDCNKTLMESQEILAKVLGSSNTFELMKNLTPEESIVLKKVDNIEYEKQAQLFISELNNLLMADNSGNSSVKECYFEVKEGYLILVLSAVRNLVKHKYCFYFGEDTNDYKIYAELIYSGFVNSDANKIQDFKLSHMPKDSKKSLLLGNEIIKILEKASLLEEYDQFEYFGNKIIKHNNFYIIRMQAGINEFEVKGKYFEKKYSLVSNMFFTQEPPVYFDDSKRFLNITDYYKAEALSKWDDQEISIQQLEKDFKDEYTPFADKKKLIEYYTEMFSDNGKKICKQYWECDKHGVLINHQVN